MLTRIRKPQFQWLGFSLPVVRGAQPVTLLPRLLLQIYLISYHAQLSIAE